MPDQQHKRGFLSKFNAFEKGRTFPGLRRVALDNGVQFGSLFSEPLITVDADGRHQQSLLLSRAPRCVNVRRMASSTVSSFVPTSSARNRRTK